jgi:hypothetical protein
MKKLTTIVWASACIVSSSVHAEDALNCKVYQPEPKKLAQCLLLDYKHFMKVDPDTLADGLRLIKQGDRYFKMKDYYNAYEAYDMARVNSRNPYAQIRTGDAAFAPLPTTKRFRSYYGKATGTCFTSDAFIHMADDITTTYWETGLELAKILKIPPKVNKAMVADVKRKITCMRALAEHYKQTKPACVDVAKVDACYTGIPAKADSQSVR